MLMVTKHTMPRITMELLWWMLILLVLDRLSNTLVRSLTEPTLMEHRVGLTAFMPPVELLVCCMVVQLVEAGLGLVVVVVVVLVQYALEEVGAPLMSTLVLKGSESILINVTCFFEILVMLFCSFCVIFGLVVIWLG